MSLNLIPNEVIGYRIKPDWYNYTVVLIKRHGTQSKNPGSEYEVSLAYCKNLSSAANFIFNHSLKLKAELSQKEIESITGTVSSVEAILAAVSHAQNEVEKSVADLERRLISNNILKPRDIIGN